MPSGDRIKAGLKPAEESVAVRCFGVARTQDQGAQRGREGQGHEARDDDRDGDGDGELTVEGAGDAAEEGDRQENRDEHEHDRDNRAADLAHGGDGGVERRHALLMHEALDVLEHHDCVVHDDADSDDHREERQGVDTEAEKPQAREGADERDWHGQHRDERRAPAAEEEEDDQDDEDAGLEERVLDLGNGGLHEACGVEGNLVVDAGREALGQRGDLGLHGVGDVQRVGAGGEEDTDADGGLAVERRLLLVALGAELKASHVTQTQRAGGAGGANDDLAELFRRREAAGGDDRHGEGLTIGRGFLAEAAGGVLVIRRADGLGDVARGHAEARHLVRLKPDAHRVVAGTEHAGVADPRDALDLVDEINGGVVAEVD